MGLVELEEGAGVLGGVSGEGFRGKVEGVGGALGDVGEERRLVGFAPVGIGGEVGAIGFEHEAVDTLCAESLPDRLGVFVGEDTGEGGAASALVNALDFFRAVAEAVEDNILPVHTGLVDYAESIFEGVAAMDNDGDFEFASEGELLGKGGFLMEDDLSGGDGVFGEVKVIEADFSEGDGGVGGHKEGADLADGAGPFGIDIAGV